MAISKAKTVGQYLRSLPADRREALTAVRETVNASLPRGYEEGMLYGMIGWYIPLSRFPDTYNGMPLCIAGRAAQKTTNTLYLMGPYGDPKQRKLLEDECRAAGKKFDMGKSCLHFSAVEALPLKAVRTVLRAIPVDDLIEQHEKAHASRRAAGKFRKYKTARPVAKRARVKPKPRAASRKRS